MTSTANDLAPACAAPDPAPHAPSITLPAGACDCHAHICGPAAKFSYIAERLYTPPDALLPHYRTMLAALGVERAVLVQPSVYGSDNASMLEALAHAGSGFRGVAVVEPGISDRELDALHQAGIRGVRINAVDVKTDKGVIDLDGLKALAAKIRRLGWHMEFLLHVNEFPNLGTMFANFPIDVVFGHLGYMPTRLGAQTPGFQGLLRLMRDGKAWAKLTGPYRISAEPLPYMDVTQFAHMLLDAAPDQLVWGTDWPHVMLRGKMPNDGDLCSLLGAWIPDEALRTKVLVQNPARLYDF
jgi:predicted TIM-barrel fold metal-dependent hydrolase